MAALIRPWSSPGEKRKELSRAVKTDDVVFVGAGGRGRGAVVEVATHGHCECAFSIESQDVITSWNEGWERRDFAHEQLEG